ncbi:hypothetical protein BDV98DRAFT_608953, partial [Pterulicium gracile]
MTTSESLLDLKPPPSPPLLLLPSSSGPFLSPSPILSSTSLLKIMLTFPSRSLNADQAQSAVLIPSTRVKHILLVVHRAELNAERYGGRCNASRDFSNENSLRRIDHQPSSLLHAELLAISSTQDASDLARIWASIRGGRVQRELEGRAGLGGVEGAERIKGIGGIGGIEGDGSSVWSFCISPGCSVP